MDIDHGNKSPLQPRVVPAGEFKARCLKLMDEVHDSGTEIVITKRGKPVAKLVPAADETRPLFGAMKDTFRILGDIVEPLDVTWEAEANDRDT